MLKYRIRTIHLVGMFILSALALYQGNAWWQGREVGTTVFIESVSVEALGPRLHLIVEGSDVIRSIQTDEPSNSLIVSSAYRDREAAVQELRQTIASPALNAATFLGIPLAEAREMIADLQQATGGPKRSQSAVVR